MSLTEQDKESIAAKVLEGLARAAKDCPPLCPLGLTENHAKVFRGISRAAYAIGMTVAVTIIGAFISGMLVIVWQGFKKVIHE